MDNKPVNDPLPQSNQSSPQPENTAAKSFFRLPILLTILAENLKMKVKNA